MFLIVWHLLIKLRASGQFLSLLADTRGWFVKIKEYRVFLCFECIAAKKWQKDPTGQTAVSRNIALISLKDPVHQVLKRVKQTADSYSRSAGDGEDGGLEEVLGELDGVERGRRDDELHLGPQFDGLLEEAEEDVRRDGPLVGLVQHDARVRPHLGVDQSLP